ncbi:MAG: peptidase M24 [SAR324 cluster bacterium]|uniref:Peptidase M24 n=1 Tax=SAR324 cluster bacterium TaxID=2024889 RepID=A0A2A4T8V5_9DELT|nr:MAG: peptidase M24 [SAR324 cluster bacterium]
MSLLLIKGKTMNKIAEKIEALRASMAQNGISAYIIPSSDPHSSEYVAEHWQGRSWISGFTGSAGTIVVTKQEAGLWTDFRYFIQAENELEGTGIQLFKEGTPDVPSFSAWLLEVLEVEDTLAFDGKVMTLAATRNLEKALEGKQIKIMGERDLLEDVWSDRPSKPTDEIFLHDVLYAGQTTQEKLTEVRQLMIGKNVDAHLITSLDDVAWLFNIRGTDVLHCPVAVAYALITQEQAFFFIEAEKVPQPVREKLEKDGIILRSYQQVEQGLQELSEKSSLLINPNLINANLYGAIPGHIRVLEGKQLTTRLKAIKNSVEVEQFQVCMKRDGAAMVRFMMWLDEQVPTGKVTELSAADQLEQFRRQGEGFISLSFTTIPGYKEHGAIVHYASSPETDVTIGQESFFLVDSGGQYLDGTTDITRTFNFGTLTEEERRDYTLVLKGNIRLAKSRFKRGTCGFQLDVLARESMWEWGIDYGHGTGHGVGFCLNVHEGPHSISQKPVDTPLEPGMLVTDEPGIYRAGKHGIRIENILLVTKDYKTEFGEFYRFEPMTSAPINTKPLMKELMTADEIAWLNAYHEKVCNELSPLLTEAECRWLQDNTQAI